MEKHETNSFVMNGKECSQSYSNNSYYQKLSANVEKQKIDEEISKKLDVQSLCCESKIFRLVDMGSSVGPNTFISVQNVLDAITKKCLPSEIPEFQVFFNDLTSNDFNTLFNSLPKEKQYYAAGVPGSFYNRLFPNSSIHFVHAAYALHWLSKMPEELLNEKSASWNEGRIHYTNAPDEVLKAYADSYSKDMGNFLDSRAKEIVQGGMIIIISPCILDGMPHSQVPTGLMLNIMGTTLTDMASEGLINKTQVDSFNLPFYSPSLEEVRRLVEKNDCFSIERMELSNPSPWLRGPINIPEWMAHIRAAMKQMFIPHFTSEVVDEMFNRTTNKLIEHSDMLESCYRDKIQLLVVLKRK